jgi:tetratricopeptide (TPR) repeat protein
MKTDSTENIISKSGMRVTVVFAGIYAFTAAALCFVPLFNLLGYEFAQAIAILTVLTVGPLAAWTIEQKPVSVNETFSGIAIKSITLLIVALVPILLNSLRVPLCNPPDGFRFYLLLPVASAVLACTIALVCTFAAESKLRRIGLYYLIVCAWLALDIWRVYDQPPVAYFSALWGFFPGPLYDEALKPGRALFLSRTATLLFSAAIICLIQIRVRKNILRRGKWLLLLVIVLALSQWYDNSASGAGINLSREQLRQELGGVTETDNLTIYHDEYFPHDELKLFVEDAEYNFARLRTFFGYAPSRKLAIYLYQSTGQKKRLFGAGKTSIADVPHGELHINRSGFPHRILRHELAHLFSYDIGPGPFGAPLTKIGLVEGLAVAADFGFTALDPDDATPHQVAAESRARGKLPAMSSLIGTLDFYGKANSLAYAVVGSFCRWLIDNRSMALFAKVYSGEDFESVYGESLPELETKWHAFLETVEIPPSAAASAVAKIKRRPIFRKTCARENASIMSEAGRSLRAGNYARAGELAQQASDNDPDCAACRFSLVKAAYADEDCERMNHAFAGLKNHEYVTPRMIERGINWQGNCAWRDGESESAEEIYLSLQETAHGEGLKRELAAKLYLLRDEGLPPLIDYFLGKPESARLLALAAEGVILDPENSLANYLLGRQLFFMGQYEQSLTWLAKSLAGESISEKIRLELLRLYLRAAYLAGKNELFAMVLDELGQSETGESLKLGLAEWRGRLAFRLSHQPKY